VLAKRYVIRDGEVLYGDRSPPGTDRRVALFVPRERCGVIQSWVVLRGDRSMGHRALVAYERTDGQHTLHYSHWGAANLQTQAPNFGRNTVR
jgi:hypothetical protein